MVAVFERLEVSLLERLLGAVSQDSALQLVSFSNQPQGQGHSIPDARIAARFDFWFETKTEPNSLNEQQLIEHRKNLQDDTSDERLFVVTPDPEKPELIDSMNDDRVVWFNFQALSDAIEVLLDDKSAFVGEQTRFLLRELQQLFFEEGLTDVADTVIVAARRAWGEYQKYGVYICQPNRSFRPGLTHLGFYTEGAIQPTIAKILTKYADAISFDDSTIKKLLKGDEFDKRLAAIIGGSVEDRRRTLGQPYQVFLLSRNEEEGSIELKKKIVNTNTAASGKRWAWTLSQRYTRLTALTADRVANTTELEEAGG